MLVNSYVLKDVNFFFFSILLQYAKQAFTEKEI